MLRLRYWHSLSIHVFPSERKAATQPMNKASRLTFKFLVEDIRMRRYAGAEVPKYLFLTNVNNSTDAYAAKIKKNGSIGTL